MAYVEPHGHVIPHRPPPAIPPQAFQPVPALPNRPVLQQQSLSSPALPSLPPRPLTSQQQQPLPPRPAPPIPGALGIDPQSTYNMHQHPPPFINSTSAPTLPPRPGSTITRETPPTPQLPSLPQRTQGEVAMPLPPRPAPRVPPSHQHQTSHCTTDNHAHVAPSIERGEEKQRTLKKLPPLPCNAETLTTTATATTIPLSSNEANTHAVKDLYSHYRHDSNDEFENYVTKRAAEAAADAALNEEHQAKVGSAIGSAAKNEVYQQKAADYLSSHTDNKYIQSAVQSKKLQERTGRAFAAVAENKTVQHQVGHAVSEGLRNEQAQQHVKEGVKKGSKRAFGWGKDAIKASLTDHHVEQHSDVC